MVERSQTAVRWIVQPCDSDHIQVEDVEDLSMKELADAINVAFLEPLEEYRLPQSLSRCH